MSDEELIARLRKADEYEPLGHDGWEAADRIEQLVATNEELTKERDEADDLAKAAFADGASNNIRLAETAHRIKTLTAELATCEKYRDAYAGCDRIGTQAVRDLEAKLAKAVEAWIKVNQHEGVIVECRGDDAANTWNALCATLAEIKGESHE